MTTTETTTGELADLCATHGTKFILAMFVDLRGKREMPLGNAIDPRSPDPPTHTSHVASWARTTGDTSDSNESGVGDR